MVMILLFFFFCCRHCLLSSPSLSFVTMVLDWYPDTSCLSATFSQRHVLAVDTAVAGGSGGGAVVVVIILIGIIVIILLSSTYALVQFYESLILLYFSKADMK